MTLLESLKNIVVGLKEAQTSKLLPKIVGDLAREFKLLADFHQISGLTYFITGKSKSLVFIYDGNSYGNGSFLFPRDLFSLNDFKDLRDLVDINPSSDLDVDLPNEETNREWFIELSLKDPNTLPNVVDRIRDILKAKLPEIKKLIQQYTRTKSQLASALMKALPGNKVVPEYTVEFGHEFLYIHDPSGKATCWELHLEPVEDTKPSIFSRMTITAISHEAVCNEGPINSFIALADSHKLAKLTKAVPAATNAAFSRTPDIGLVIEFNSGAKIKDIVSVVKYLVEGS